MRPLPTLALLLAIASPLSLAADVSRNCRIGEIVRVHGLVKVIREGQTLVPVAGENICVKDRFMTDTRGVTELKFSDGTEVTVGKDSVFVISRWKQRRLLANEARFELLTGAFRALTGAVTQRRHHFEVTTPVATIGIRGTEFWGGLDMSPGALDVVMLNGKGVYLVNEAGQVEITEPGKGVTVRSGSKPGDPVVWPPEKLKRAMSAITP